MINGKQYKYIGNIEDNGGGENKINCALCGTDIRYEFELENINDVNDVIKIGCECVKKFDGTLTKIVDKDKRKYLKSKKDERILNILVQLTTLHTDTDYNNFIKYFENRGGFTPNQIIRLHLNMQKFNIEFIYSDFKIMLTRKNEKEQMKLLDNFKKGIVFKFLSPIQINKYK